MTLLIWGWSFGDLTFIIIVRVKGCCIFQCPNKQMISSMKWGTVQGSVKHCVRSLKTTLKLRAYALSDEKFKVTDNASFNRVRSRTDF